MRISCKYTHIPSLLSPTPKPTCYLSRSSQSTELRSLNYAAACLLEFNNLVLVYYLINNGHATQAHQQALAFGSAPGRGSMTPQPG